MAPSGFRNGWAHIRHGWGRRRCVPHHGHSIVSGVHGRARHILQTRPRIPTPWGQEPLGGDKSKIVFLRELDAGAKQIRCVLAAWGSGRYGCCESGSEESEGAVVDARDEDEDSALLLPRQNPKGLFRRIDHPNGLLRWTRRQSLPRRPLHGRRGTGCKCTVMSRIRSMMWLRNMQDLGYSQ